METTIQNYEIRKAKMTIEDRDVFIRIIQRIAELYSIHIVCFDADKMAGRDHAIAAIQHAQRSFFSGKPISNSFEMEALLFAAGSRQCLLAALFGIKEGDNSVFVCTYPLNEQVWKDLSCLMHFVDNTSDCMTLEKEEKLITLFNITEKELDVTGRNRIKDLIIERIALLNVNR